MKIRRYYGYDCDSVCGFNNGRYVDSDFIEVRDEKHLETLCVGFLNEVSDNSLPIEESSDFTFTRITGYFDQDGNEINEEKYQELLDEDRDVSYRYIYVSAETSEL